MSHNPQDSHSTSLDDTNATFLIRWRGRQEGPYTAAVIEAKLAANQIGLLHELSMDGQWVTLRDYLSRREAAFRAEEQARQEQERRAREASERQTKERDERHRAELLVEERRKNDLLQARLADRSDHEAFRQEQPAVARRPHRAGTLMALAIIGLLVCGPLCIAAWAMGSSDLHEMDAGLMDNSGRSSTASARSIGVVGTVLWTIGMLVFFLF